MTAQDLDNLAARFGIDEIAALPAGPAPVDHTAFRRACQGAPADMSYLGRTVEKRLNPLLVMPGVRTIIVGLVGYGDVPARPSPLPAGSGWISRYAMCRDYHVVAGEKFRALADAVRTGHSARAIWYVDTGPVAEKAWAAAAGLGFQGKNTLLVSPRHGSFAFLGVILTDAVIDAPARPAVASGCHGCHACVDACPVNALDGLGGLDRVRCLAHVTAGSRVPAPDGLDLAGNLFGCDICQDVCPYNAPRRTPDRAAEDGVSPAHPLAPPAGPSPFTPLPGLFCPGLDDVLNMDEAAFDRIFSGSPVLRRGLAAVQDIARRLHGSRPD